MNAARKFKKKHAKSLKRMPTKNPMYRKEQRTKMKSLGQYSKPFLHALQFYQHSMRLVTQEKMKRQTKVEKKDFQRQANK